MLKDNSTLFISDLHLEPTQPQITKLFLDFLTKQAVAAEALYILGDLFEVWIGDDNNNDFNKLIKSNLKKLTASGIPVYIMPGNRDFLLGKKFSQETGCQILKDPTCINLYGVKTLLMHGDSLCTADIRHQYFRRFSQSLLIRYLFLLIPLKIRKLIASKIRNTSKKRTDHLPENIMNVTQAKVINMMHNHQANTLIHGHTHQPDIHNFQIDNQTMKRIVLGAWHNAGSVLICQPNTQPQLIKFN